MKSSKSRLLGIIATIIVAVIVLAVRATNEGADTAPVTPDGLESATVVRVVDGDTIIVRLDGREQRVRYIGVDTPETVKPDTPEECYGKQASDENHRLVDGQTVYLERDVSNTDDFDRLLRYVYIDGEQDQPRRFVNLLLVEGGFAEARSYPPNTSRQSELDAAERDARAAGRGMWSACPVSLSR